VNDYEFLRGRQNEPDVKDLCVARAAAADTFHFKCPYKMAYHRSSGNGLNWADGHLEYKEIRTVLTVSVAGFEHLYAYSFSKCTFLAGLTGRPIHNHRGSRVPTIHLLHSQTLVYIAVSQVSQICLRNQNNAFPIQLVNVLSAEERFCPMCSLNDASFCRICCSSIKTPIEHIQHHCAGAMATSRQPATKRKRALGQLMPDASSDTCPYWPASPAFHHQRVQLRHLFFINSDRIMCVSIGFYPARDYQPLVEFDAIRRGGSKSFILKDEHHETLADCLPKKLVSICNGGGTGAGCVSGAFSQSHRKYSGRQDCISPRNILA